MLNESNKTAPTIFPSSNHNEPTFAKTSVSAQKSSTFETDSLLSSPKLSAPLFVKKAKSQGANGEMGKTQPNQAAMVDGIGKVKKTDESKEAAKDGELHQKQPSQRPFNPFAKSLNNQEKKAGEGDQVQTNRPSNPLLKSFIK